MSAYVDCFACACLIRAREPSCPFCGASQRLAPAPSSKLSLGLTVGLGLAAFSCGDKEEETASDTIADSSEADAVTYAGPDSLDSTTGPGSTTVEDLGTTTIINDSSEADAVTYAGPDETTAIGDATTSGTTSDTTSGTTSGTTSDTDPQEADAVTYAGPDETSTTGG
jgi:hypothetical protein